MNILAAGIRWLYGTEQPDGAIQQHLGISIPDVPANRLYGFCPSGSGALPVVSVQVSRPVFSRPGPYGEIVNGIGLHELDDIRAELAVLDVEVSHTWNGHPGISGSLGLTVEAHPSLLAAVARYRAGCPNHPGKILCSWDGCPWFGTGDALIVRPTLVGGAV
jgi:hypothetical protein